MFRRLSTDCLLAVDLDVDQVLIAMSIEYQLTVDEDVNRGYRSTLDRHSTADDFRLFTVPYFSERSQMSIIEFDRRPSWSLDASETGESTKCPWVEAVGLIAWG